MSYFLCRDLSPTNRSFPERLISAGVRSPTAAICICSLLTCHSATGPTSVTHACLHFRCKTPTSGRAIRASGEAKRKNTGGATSPMALNTKGTFRANLSQRGSGEKRQTPSETKRQHSASLRGSISTSKTARKLAIFSPELDYVAVSRLALGGDGAIRTLGRSNPPMAV